MSLKTELATSKQRKNKQCKQKPLYHCQETCWFPELDLYVYRLKTSLRARLSFTAGPLTLLINLRWHRGEEEAVLHLNTCSSLVMALHGNSSKLRWGWGLGFLLENRQGELGTLGMMSDRTSLPLAMSLPGNWEEGKRRRMSAPSPTDAQPKRRPGERATHLPLELAVGPVPVGADGRGDVAAHAALGEKVQGRELLVVQEGVAVVLVAHRHRGEELLAALWAGHAGAAGRQVPPAQRQCNRHSGSQWHLQLLNGKSFLLITMHCDRTHTWFIQDSKWRVGVAEQTRLCVHAKNKESV